MSDQTKGGPRRHFNYSNVMSTLAVFLVVAGGTAMAAKVNDSGDIAKQSVKNSDVKKNTLKSNRLKDGKAVGTVDVIDDDLTGTDINEATLQGVSPTGPAGGSLAGNYPNPTLAPNSVGSGEVNDNSLTGADVDERSLGLASAYAQRTADLDLSGPFEDVLTTTITTGAESRILATGIVEVEADGGDNDDAGCQIRIAGTDGPETNFTVPDTDNNQNTTSAGFSRVLPAGSHAVALRCDESGTISVDDAELLVHGLPQ